MLRLRYKLVIIKTHSSMNKHTVSSKFVLMIATMLPAILLVTSLTLSLVPTTAFAQNAESNNQRDIHENQGGDSSVVVDPIVQPDIGVALNIAVNTHIIT